MRILQRNTLPFFLALWSLLRVTYAFVGPAITGIKPAGSLPSMRNFKSVILFAELPDISTMKLGDMRQELESYGISTKAFLEKKEFVSALEKARSEGKKPINGDKKKKTASSDSSGVSREERIKKEMEKANSMKVGELKKELKNMGVSTKSFFEKSEFVKAYAEAVVDGVKKKAGASSRSQEEEEYDPSYRDVVVQKFDARSQQLLLRGTLIDIKV